MFNVLPENLKEKIRTDYRLRRFILTLGFILFTQISTLIFLFPSWVVSEYREKEVLALTEEMNRLSIVSTVNIVASKISTTNMKLKVLNTALEYPEALPYVNTILSKKTGNIHILSLQYSSTDKMTATVLVEGVSSTRDSLVSFVNNLEKTGSFKTVDLPVSNLAKEKNLNFSITLTIGKK